MENLLDFISVAKYIVGLLGITGIIIIITGAFQRQTELIQRGVLLFITALALFICGYFIVQKTQSRIETMETDYEFYYNRHNK